MNETLFVSDIHLDVKRSAIVDLFNHFLIKRAIHADALYILGDLFEYWIGDDAPYPEYTATFEALRKVSDNNVSVYFLHGNRDFLIAKDFSNLTGAKLLNEEFVANIYDQEILLMHGDTLCVDDIEYQRFRKKTQSKFLQWIVLHLPISTRQSLAGHLRKTSAQAIADKSSDIMDVNQTAVESAMKRNNSRTLIHGHTHRAGIHEFEIDKISYTRAVLGDWYSHGSVISMTKNGLELESFSSI